MAVGCNGGVSRKRRDPDQVETALAQGREILTAGTDWRAAHTTSWPFGVLQFRDVLC